MRIITLEKSFDKISLFVFVIVLHRIVTMSRVVEALKEPNLSTRIIRTKYGDVRGSVKYLDSRYLDPIEVFLGIPYASPPVGHLRFMPPVTAALWSNVLLATRFSPVCPQRLPDIANETLALKKMPRGRLEHLRRLFVHLQNQSEDCLYLNIYAPMQSTNNPNKYPVIVFIHGESFEWNSGNPYDGSVLASYGKVIVVTINYRLGVLGFLNANTDPFSKSPSNYGLMDQVAALHWLQENIASFGGDARNVTVIGHGTGAACVHFLLSSIAVPEGILFHRAVLMSGSGLSPWALVKNPSRNAALIALHANCSLELNHAELLQCLRERSAKTLLQAQQMVRAPKFFYAFGPSVDGVIIDTDEFDMDPVNRNSGSGSDTNKNRPQYYEIYDYGTGKIQLRRKTERNFRPDSNSNFNSNDQLNILNLALVRKNAITKMSKYDLIIGAVKAEAFFDFNSHDIQYGIESDRRSKILKSFVRNTYNYHLSEILVTIINEYTEWERPVQHPINVRDETLEALSDAQVIAPIIQTADLHSSSRRNSYLYIFDYQTKSSDYPQRQGCVHGEDLPYLFGAPLVGGLMHFAKNYTKAEIMLSETVMIYWTNFAKTGNPNEANILNVQNIDHDSTPINNQDISFYSRSESFNLNKNKVKNIEWVSYENTHKRYLNFDIKSKLKNHFRAHRLSFWLNLVPDLHKPGGDNVPRTHHEFADGKIPDNDDIYAKKDDHNDDDDDDDENAGDAAAAADDDDDDEFNDNNFHRKHKNRNYPTLAPPKYTKNFTKITNETASENRSLSIAAIETGTVATNHTLTTIKSIVTIDNENERTINKSLRNFGDNTKHFFALFDNSLPDNYTALIFIVTIGVFLLFLNLLIFAGIYYTRDKHNIVKKQRKENGLAPHCISGDLESSTSSLGPNVNTGNVGILKNTPIILSNHSHQHHHHQQQQQQQHHHHHHQQQQQHQFHDLRQYHKHSLSPGKNQYADSFPISGLATLPRAPPPPKKVQISCEQQPLLVNQSFVKKSSLKSPSNGGGGASATADLNCGQNESLESIMQELKV